MGKIYTFTPDKVAQESTRQSGLYIGMLELSTTRFHIEETTESYSFNNKLSVRIPPWWPDFARKLMRQMLIDAANEIQAQVCDFICDHQLPLRPEPGWKPPPKPEPAPIYHLMPPASPGGPPGLFDEIEESEKAEND